ncbi:MAG: hypothetical protein PHF11_00685 [Candidatus Omnitrophica bacterium]|nr:hypothetical protein [Candidatus Omnitrophota bacterium]
MGNWEVILVEPAKNVISQIGQFLVNVLLVIIILIVGWVISKLIKALVTKGLRVLRIDQISSRIELDDLLAKGGINYSLSELVGVICYWLGLLVTFVVAINALGLTIAADLLNRVILYIPNIIAAIFILILGMFVATLLRNIVQTAASNAGLSQANLLSRIVDAVIIVFTIAIALEQLNIGARIIELITMVVLGAMGLAAALAFGLGCKDIAAKFVSELLNNIKSKK